MRLHLFQRPGTICPVLSRGWALYPPFHGPSRRVRIASPSRLVSLLLLAALAAGGLAVVLSAVAPGGAWWGGLGGLLIVALGLRRPWRRWRVARQVLSAQDQAWLAAHVPVYHAAEPAARRRFERDLLFFLDENTFEGVAGTEVTEALKLQVAAGAALLLHGRPTWELPGGRTILFYPTTFDDDYYGGTDAADFDGMVHDQGPIILSVPAVREGWRRANGSNVVLHELAHLFDMESEGADGVPSLVARGSEEAWRRLVRREIQRIRIGKSVLRRYGATNASELFAVAVEMFFERPRRLHRHHRPLYDGLVALFNLDPMHYLPPDPPVAPRPDDPVNTEAS
ncbi:MAG: zinc-dependent peptidase [Bacteroidota bacterium]